jgi:hypothetical protein
LICCPFWPFIWVLVNACFTDVEYNEALLHPVFVLSPMLFLYFLYIWAIFLQACGTWTLSLRVLLVFAGMYLRLTCSVRYCCLVLFVCSAVLIPGVVVRIHPDLRLT